MSLSWKDAVSTILIAGIGLIALAVAGDWWPWLTIRWAVVGVSILGVAACVAGSDSSSELPDPYNTLMNVIVGIAAIAALLGLIFGHKSYLIILAALSGLLWLITTIRHAVSR